MYLACKGLKYKIPEILWASRVIEGFISKRAQTDDNSLQLWVDIIEDTLNEIILAKESFDKESYEELSKIFTDLISFKENQFKEKAQKLLTTLNKYYYK